MTPPVSGGVIYFSRDIIMATHRYAPGQSVRLSPPRTDAGSARGVYTIVTKLPEEGNVPQYRIRAKADGRERVVRENELNRV
jgi:antitoxin component YwqK of YwqJK toxin-antitoxin module